MTRWLRFLLTLLRAATRPKLGLDQESTIDRRVWPTDADLTLMNHARYLPVLEQGRVDFILRTGFLRLLVRNRWTALLGSIVLQFRKPLRRFERFRIRTRLVHWDDRWFYLEQRIERGDVLVAFGVVKIAIMGPAGRLAPAEAVRSLGYSVASPPISPMLERLREGEQLMKTRSLQWPTVEWSAES